MQATYVTLNFLVATFFVLESKKKVGIGEVNFNKFKVKNKYKDIYIIFLY